MSSKIRFIVPGEPQGKARPRVVRTANGKTHTYTPDKTAAYEELVRVCCRQVCENLLEGELCAAITARFAIPKSSSKKCRIAMESGAIRPIKRPDADNIAKIILDALNGLAYADDSQITMLMVKKEYSEQPEVEVEVWVRHKSS